MRTTNNYSLDLCLSLDKELRKLLSYKGFIRKDISDNKFFEAKEFKAYTINLSYLGIDWNTVGAGVSKQIRSENSTEIVIKQRVLNVSKAKDKLVSELLFLCDVKDKKYLKKFNYYLIRKFECIPHNGGFLIYCILAPFFLVESELTKKEQSLLSDFKSLYHKFKKYHRKLYKL